jgi:hypothetical protein
MNSEQGTVLLLVAVKVNGGIKTYGAFGHRVFVANSVGGWVSTVFSTYSHCFP